MKTFNLKKTTGSLKIGGVLHYADKGKFSILSPFHPTAKVSEETAKELLATGCYQCVSCGINGFWWSCK